MINEILQVLQVQAASSSKKGKVALLLDEYNQRHVSECAKLNSQVMQLTLESKQSQQAQLMRDEEQFGLQQEIARQEEKLFQLEQAKVELRERREKLSQKTQS